MLEIGALIAGTLFTFLIALAVFIKNSKSITNILFMGLAGSLIFWSLATFFSLRATSEAQQLLWQRPIMFFVVLQNTFFFLLVRVFPLNQSNFLKSKKIKIAIAYSVVTAIVAASPFLFVAFEDGAPVPGPGMALFLPHAIIFAIGGIILLFRRFFRAKGVEKAQLQYFLAGTVLLYTLVPIANFIAPVAFQSQLLLRLSPLYAIVFSALFAYAIVAQKLFDIRATVARSVAYVLSLGFIGLVYGVLVFLLFSATNLSSISDTAERAVFVGLALITATVYPVTKKYFDRVTKQLFYQDAYDSQDFLERINKLLVGQIELEQLLTGITNVIEDNLKSSYCVFIVRETAYEDVRIVGSEQHKFNQEKIKELRELTPHTHKKVLVTDEVGSDDEALKNALDALDVSILIRLVSNEKLDLEGMGYLALGPKRNGTVYSNQDRQVLNILANEMIIAVENALRFEEIEKFNITLQDKVDSATAELKRTNTKLQELDETKDEFISMASHQLRTPLTSVKGYLSMVLEGDVGKVNKQQNRMLEQAFLSSQRMVYLIADLLNVSRLKSGKFVIDFKDANLADVIETEVEQLKPTAKARDLTLNFQKPKDFPVVAIDETKIRQVIMNFIDNAIYYTPAGGKIDVYLEDKGETIEYRVTDNGIGVPKAERHNLFNKFYRADNARSARPDGTGLGLFMAKKVVVAQGGAIIFETEEGKGSTFGFSFAKEKLHKLATETLEADQTK